MEEETQRMEAKLDVLRRTLDPLATEAACKGGEVAARGGEGGRWKSGSGAKPLTRNYVKGVLDAPDGRSVGQPRGGSQQRAPRAAGSGTVTPQEAAPLGDFLTSGTSAPATTAAPAGRAVANVQAAVQQQSSEALEVEAFLAGLSLDRYLALFMEHGFDCMEVVQDMQEHHMRELGMASGHILKLKKKLQELAPGDSTSAVATSAPVAVAAAGPGASQRRVSFGASEAAPVQAQSCGGVTFDEEESAASFQEALKAWRAGRSGPSPAPAKAATGSFWSTVGDNEVDLVRASTPINRPIEVEVSTTADTETQRDPAPSEDKLCCYQCYKQFYAKFAVERQSPLPEHGNSRDIGPRRLCSEECADRWVAAATAKAQALQRRQEKLEHMQEVSRVLQEEQSRAQAMAEAGPSVVSVA